MSRRNREKRAAKQKNRRRGSAEGQRTGFNPGSGPDREFIQAMLVLALHQAAMCPEDDSQAHAAELIEEFCASARDLDLAADVAMLDAIGAAWEGGWSPSDLYEFARRKLEPSAVGYLTEAIVRESTRYAVSTLHPRWRADLAAISAGVDPNAQTPQMWHWAAVNGTDRCAALTVVLKVLALLGTLVVLEQLLPLPGVR